MAGPGLYANIHAKRKRGGKMRKKGAKGAPTEANFARAKQTVKKAIGGKVMQGVKALKNKTKKKKPTGPANPNLRQGEIIKSKNEGRTKAMGGGMMKRPMMKRGGKAK